jgi:catechol 2,3-dioxygenase-like lactoylglutathione lyase family enzyme
MPRPGSYSVMTVCRNTDILCRNTGLATTGIQGEYRSMANEFRLSHQSIIAFVATSDPDRARRFYGDILGLPLVSEEMPFALVFDAHGTMLRVTIVDKPVIAGYTVLGWQVPNIGAAAKALSEAGVRFERFPGMQQDELGIWSSPGGASVAWFKDPDGNTLSISQH